MSSNGSLQHFLTWGLGNRYHSWSSGFMSKKLSKEMRRVIAHDGGQLDIL